MNSTQMNKFLSDKKVLEHHKFIAIDCDGEVYSFIKEPSFSKLVFKRGIWIIYGMSLNENAGEFIGNYREPKNPELELYTYE